MITLRFQDGTTSRPKGGFVIRLAGLPTRMPSVPGCRRRATPLWADIEKIKAIYQERKRVSRDTGVKHHVDHIIPIKGRLVCGLHVPENLRIIPAIENQRKHNKFEDGSQ